MEISVQPKNMPYPITTYGLRYSLSFEGYFFPALIFKSICETAETVKGYANHEEEVLTAVTQARASVGSAKSVNEAVEANNSLGSALSRLLIVSENYPQLQANTNFMSLMNELRTLESQIAVSRQFYNDTCMKYNEKRETFPANIIANMFKFKEAAYFTATEEQKTAPRVKFD